MVARLKRCQPILKIPRRHGRRGEQNEGDQGRDQGARLRSVAEINGG